MRKRTIVLLFSLLTLLFSRAGATLSQAEPFSGKMALKLFYVYSDHGSPENHFTPSGWMGDHTDLAFIPDSAENPYSGPTCIKIVYGNKATKGARWAGIYWQEPANNWGSVPNAGFDLTGIQKLTFWARGEKGGEQIDQFKVGGTPGLYPDSSTSGLGPVVLSGQWQQYTIDLTGKDLSHIIGGFAWAANLDGNPNGCTFYLDEIRYE